MAFYKEKLLRFLHRILFPLLSVNSLTSYWLSPACQHLQAKNRDVFSLFPFRVCESSNIFSLVDLDLWASVETSHGCTSFHQACHQREPNVLIMWPVLSLPPTTQIRQGTSGQQPWIPPHIIQQQLGYSRIKATWGESPYIYRPVWHKRKQGAEGGQDGNTKWNR